MNTWLIHHTQALTLVLTRFKTNLFSHLFIALTIAVSLALPMIAYLILSSFNGLVSAIKSDSHLSVFLSTEATPTMIDSIHNTLATREGIKQFQFVSKEDALKQLMADNNNQDVMLTLSENPLPDAFFIEPTTLDSATIQQLKDTLTKIDGIDHVQVDDAWLKRLGYLLAIGKKALFVLAMLLGFALFTVIGNTIRMQILTQQEEIEVSQLIGATHRFIRRPFLYAGAIYGTIGTLFAMLITSIVIGLFNSSIEALATEYQTDFSLHFPGIAVLVVTGLIAITIGLFSAYIAVSKSLFKSIN